MSENLENVFGEEAQEEALLSRVESSTDDRNSKSNVRASIEESHTDSATESSPLLQTDRAERQTYHRAGSSDARATHEPWNGDHGAGSLPWYKTPSIYWLMPAFFPFCVAFGGLIIPRTYLILDLICKDYLSEKAATTPGFTYLPVVFGGPENPLCQDWHVQQRTARFNTYTDLLSGLFSALVAPHLGALSDRIGRKKVIVWASVGGLVNEAITIYVGLHPETVSVYWLLIGAFTDGLCGSFTLGMALTFSYCSDCSSPEKRNVAFGYLQGMLFLGIALGPILAGWLISLTGTVVVVFWVALGCHLFFISFTTLFVPESLSQERQLIAREKWAKKRAEHSNQSFVVFLLKTYNLIEPLSVLRPKGPGSSPTVRKNILLLALIDMMMFGVAMGAIRIVLIYAKHRFAWDAVAASVYVSICNVNRVLCLIGLLPLLNWYFRDTRRAKQGHQGSDKVDLAIIRVSIVFEFVAYLGYALTPNGMLMIVSGLVASIGGIGSPTLASSVTKHVPVDMTGQILGATGLLHALSRVIAPLTFNTIYAQTVEFFPGFVFLCLASIFIIAFILSWQLKPDVYLRTSSTLEAEQSPVAGDGQQQSI